MASSYDYYGQQKQSQQPSPYMASSSAGNPASSYGSSGGAQAGSQGTPAPTYAAPTPSYAQQKQTQQTAVQGYRAPAGANPNYPYATYTYGQPPSQEALYQAGLYATQPRPGAPAQYNSSPQQQQAFVAPYAAQQQQQAQQAYAPFQTQQYAQTGYQQTNQNTGVVPPGYGGGYAPQGVDPRFPDGQPPPPTADTNGYQMPRLVAPPASRYAMPGWDNAKWNDPNNQDPKYVVGRILSGIPGRTDQMDIATARVAAAYPGTTRVGNGDINIPGVGTIDILMKAGTGGSGWWWGAGGGSSAPATPQASATPATDYASLIQTLLAPPKAAAPAPQAAYDITQDPKYQQLAAQLAALQTQQQTWQTEQAAAARGRSPNNPSFAYY
jgi:hypothetical protein